MTAQTDKLIQDPNTGDVDANYARTTYFTYDYLGNQLTRKLPNGKVEYKEYNSLGQLTKATDFKGQITRYYYNDANAPGQLSQQRFYHDNTVDVNEPNLIIDVIHDKLGRRMRVDVNDVDNATLGKWRWWYDDQGRVTMLESPQGFVGYEYHANTGRRKSVRTPADSNDTKVCYYYDELGRLSEVNVAKRNDVPVDESTYYGYNAVGSLGVVDYNNGNLAQYSYDTLNRLTNLTNWQTSAKVTALSSYTYELSPDGQRTSATEITEGAETVITWDYDNLNRLISEDYNAPGDVNDYEHHYVYDLVGNRLKRKVVGADPNTVYYYNDNDQLTLEYTDANTHYTYDDNGSLIEEANDSVTLRTYTYDLRRRLSQVDIAGGATVDYLYNPDGMRVRATVDGNDIDYIIDPYNHTGYAQVFKEINAVTGDNTVYITGHDVLAQAVGTANPSYLLYDGHGSVRALANNAGSIVEKYNYQAYGALHNFAATPSTNLLYSGEWRDHHTGLDNLRNRWYDPSVGRFNRMDEFRGNNRDPQSLHKYLYAHANPINNVDPSGRLVGTLTDVLSYINARAMVLWSMERPYSRV
jgi:RHS repeat-associated protein